MEERGNAVKTHGHQKKTKDERKSVGKVERVEKLSVKEEGKAVVPVSKWEVFKARLAKYEVSLYHLVFQLGSSSI